MDGLALTSALSGDLEAVLRSALREIPHFLISGVLFRNISPLLARPSVCFFAAD